MPRKKKVMRDDEDVVVVTQEDLDNAVEVNLNGFMDCKNCGFPDTVKMGQSNRGKKKIKVKCNVCGEEFAVLPDEVVKCVY